MGAEQPAFPVQVDEVISMGQVHGNWGSLACMESARSTLNEAIAKECLSSTLLIQHGIDQNIQQR